MNSKVLTFWWYILHDELQSPYMTGSILHYEHRSTYMLFCGLFCRPPSASSHFQTPALVRSLEETEGGKKNGSAFFLAAFFGERQASY